LLSERGIFGSVRKRYNVPAQNCVNYRFTSDSLRSLRTSHAVEPSPKAPHRSVGVVRIADRYFFVRRLIALLIAVPLVIWLLRQCRKPSGALGARYVRAMNVAHAALTDWGLRHVTVRPGDVILDVGCGGGRTVQKLAALAPEGKVYGVDYSDASVRASRQVNADAIAAGRVEIACGSVARLPFPDQTFDVVTAVETHYYWPDLDANVREIQRVLKPGGALALVAETSRDRQRNPLYFVVMPLLGAAHLTTGEHEDLLRRTGFTDVAVDTRTGGWICATGRRPSI
jgi:ubiquinone/menaquinone biosynthesis C-methylase UbiE